MRTMWGFGILGVLLLPPGSGPAAPPTRDAFGDPLPPYACGRLGTNRFRSLNPFKAVALSPDGKILAAAESVLLAQSDRGGRIVLFDAASGKQLRVLTTVDPFAAGVLAFRARGRQLVAAGSKGIRIWDIASGKLVGRWLKQGFDVSLLSFSADGNRFAVGYRNAGKPKPVLIWDLASKKEVGRISLPQQLSAWVALSADGTAMAIVGDPDESNLVRVLDVASGKEKLRLRTASPPAGVARFSPDGKLLATVDGKATVQLWSLPNGKERWRIVPEWSDKEVEILAFSSDGKRLYAANYFNNFGIWETANAREVTCQARKVELPAGGGFRPDGSALAWGRTDQLLLVWDPVSGKLITPLGGHRVGLCALSFSSDGKGLYSLDFDAQLLRWDLARGRQRGATKLPEVLPSRGVAFSPDGRKVVGPSGVASGFVVFDTASGKRVKRLEANLPLCLHMWQVAFSADSSRVGGFPDPDHYFKDNAVAIPIWDMASGKEIGGINTVLGMGDVDPSDRRVFGALSADGKRAAIAAVVETGVVRADIKKYTTELVGWDLVRKKKLAACRFPGTARVSLALAPDGRTAIISGPGGKLFVCDVETGQWLKTVSGDWDSLSAGPVISPDGRTVAFATSGGKAGWAIRLVERATWSERRALTHTAGATFALAFSPDGKMLASGQEDTTVLLWDLLGVARSHAE